MKKLTGLRYFFRNRWIDLSLQHAKAAKFCFQYLTSEPFLCGTDDDQIFLYAKQGYYAFQDYSVQYCLSHFLSLVELGPSDTTQMAPYIVDSAGDFLKSYSLSTKVQGSDEPLSRRDVFEIFKEFPKDPKDRVAGLNIGDRTTTIRRQIERIRGTVLAFDELDVINNLYGFDRTFKCPKLWCSYFTTGFATHQDRTQHVDSHERPFRCPEEGCFASQMGFDVTEKLSQHTKRYHCTSKEEVRFPKAVSTRPLPTPPQAVSVGDGVGVSSLNQGLEPKPILNVRHNQVFDDTEQFCTRLRPREICADHIANRVLSTTWTRSRCSFLSSLMYIINFSTS